MRMFVERSLANCGELEYSTRVSPQKRGPVVCLLHLVPEIQRLSNRLKLGIALPWQLIVTGSNDRTVSKSRSVIVKTPHADDSVMERRLVCELFQGAELLRVSATNLEGKEEAASFMVVSNNRTFAPAGSNVEEALSVARRHLPFFQSVATTLRESVGSPTPSE